MRALVCSSMLILVVGGLGHPHGSTKPRRTRATGHRNILAVFLADKMRRLLETIGVAPHFASLRTLPPPCLPPHFLRRSCVAAEQQQQHQHQHQQKASGRPLPRYLPEGVLVCVLHASLLLDFMLTPLCSRDHTGAQRIGLSRNFLLTHRA